MARLGAIFSSKAKLDAESFASLEELLITSDLGVKTTAKLLESLKIRVESADENVTPEVLKKNLQSDIQRILDFGVDPEIIPVKREGQPLVVMVIGVNGVGKTTTIGKLAFQFSAQGAKVMIAACDTFRAAAVEQLSTWAERSGAEVVSGAEGAKPSTVAYQAVHRAKDEGFDVLIVDTAGRLHTRVNLMNELENVQNIIGREQAGAPHEVLLVLDASTGQNALQQAIEFNQR
ncbi:UNVERIFIED_CONTAM: hypothetical protein GTU68_064878 [Idotea baltica]|nr:hypothetical protein [Idotea baltica]